MLGCFVTARIVDELSISNENAVKHSVLFAFCSCEPGYFASGRILSRESGSDLGNEIRGILMMGKEMFKNLSRGGLAQISQAQSVLEHSIIPW